MRRCSPKGEKHKIEAHLTVRHALKVHAGKYKCNNLHTSYHILRVRAPASTLQEKNKTPFFAQGIGATGLGGHAGRAGDGYSTESGYVTIHDLTPSGENEDDLFTRTWEPLEPDTPSQTLALPTQRTTTTTTGFGGGIHHGGGGAGGGGHHHQHMPNPQQIENELKHKLIYINTTNFDGTAMAGSGAGSDGHRHGHIDKSLVDLKPIMPTSSSGRHHQQPPYQTTEHWPRQPNMIYAATPPNFPPPRTIPHDMEKMRPSQPPQHYYPYGPQMLPPSSQPEYPMYGGPGAYPAQQHKHKTHENYYQVGGAGAGAGMASGSAAQYPGAGMHMYPPSSTAIAPYYQYPVAGPAGGGHGMAPPQQPHFNEMVTFTGGRPTATIYQNPFQQYGQQMTIAQQQQLYHQLQQQQQQQLQYMTLPPYGGLAVPSGVGGTGGAGAGVVIATSAPMFATSTYGVMAPPATSTQFQQATGMISPSGNILLTHSQIPKGELHKTKFGFYC